MDVQFTHAGALARLATTAALVTCLTGTAAHPGSTTAQPAAGVTASVGDGFAEEVARAGIPGGVIARIDDGRVVETREAGDVARSSRFLWGSVSKPAAAAVVTDLAGRGRLNLSASASEYVPGAPAVPVRDLLDHTAGLDFGAGLLDHDRPGATAIAVVADHPTAGRPASPYAYSSLDYLFVQAVVERASGHTYEHALRRRFPGTRIGASETSCADVTSPHTFVAMWAAPTPRRYDGAGAAYGYTCGSIDDLAAVALDHLRSPSIAQSAPTGHPGQRYGAGWRITAEPDGRTTHWHTGTVPGYFSAVYLDPDTGDGVATLLNASGYLHEEQLAVLTRASFDRATGRRPNPVPSAPAATAYPAGIVGAALLLLVLALRTRTRGRRAALTWATAAGGLVVAVASVPALTGYPYRYFWLWEPSLVLATAVLTGALLVGAARTLPIDPHRAHFPRRPPPSDRRRVSV